jgi:hypothetical protein
VLNHLLIKFQLLERRVKPCDSRFTWEIHVHPCASLN